MKEGVKESIVSALKWTASLILGIALIVLLIWASRKFGNAPKVYTVEGLKYVEINNQVRCVTIDSLEVEFKKYDLEQTTTIYDKAK